MTLASRKRRGVRKVNRAGRCCASLAFGRRALLSNPLALGPASGPGRAAAHRFARFQLRALSTSSPRQSRTRFEGPANDVSHKWRKIRVVLFHRPSGAGPFLGRVRWFHHRLPSGSPSGTRSAHGSCEAVAGGVIGEHTRPRVSRRRLAAGLPPRLRSSKSRMRRGPAGGGSGEGAGTGPRGARSTFLLRIQPLL
jgi:hypothetical protein